MMKPVRSRLLLLFGLCLSLGGAASLGAQEAPQRRPVDDVVRLWNAKLSEDFIRRHIQGSGQVYDLAVDDIVRCKEAGVPESLIDAMLATRTKTAPGAAPSPAKAPEKVSAAPAPAVAAAAPAKVEPPATSPAPAPQAPVPTDPVPPAPAPPVSAPAAADALAPAPAAAPPPPPVVVPPAPRRWEGLVRRNPGVVLFKSSWDPGTLDVKGESLHWADAADPGKNILIPLGKLTEQFLACVESRGTGDCFEWGFRTKDDVYRFRDAAWADGRNEKVEEIFAHVGKAIPAVPAVRVPVKRK